MGHIINFSSSGSNRLGKDRWCEKIQTLKTPPSFEWDRPRPCTFTDTVHGGSSCSI